MEHPDAPLTAPLPGTSSGDRQRPVPLRAMGIGELIDAAIRLYRAEWKVLLGVVAFVQIPVTLIQLLLTQGLIGPLDGTVVPTDEAVTQVVVTGLVFGAIQLLIVQPFLIAAITRAAADVYLGEPVSIGKTYGFALSRILPILWIGILTLLAVAIGFILLIIPGIIAFVRFSFATPALVVEGLRGTSAMGRSWRLAGGKFWRILGTLIVAGLITAIVSWVITVPAEIIALSVGTAGWPISSLGSVLASVLVTPFSSLIVVLLYFDLRIRKEAFDLEVMAREVAAAQ